MDNILPPQPPPQIQPLPNPIPAQPLSTISTNVSPPTSSRGRSKLKVFLVGFLVIFFLFGSTGGVAAAIAYNKISINNPSIEKSIRAVFFSLPFLPKTPEYILKLAAMSHVKVSKHNFNISMAVKSQDFVSSLGFNQLDVEAKGFIDYSDPSNLKTSLNASVTKDFNIEVAKDDTVVYLKVNKVPKILLSFIKVDESKLNIVLENWIAIDNKPLQTEARKNMDKQNPQKQLTKEYFLNTIENLLDDKLLPHLVMSEENLAGEKVYKLHLVADDKTIDELYYKFEEQSTGIKRSDLKLSEGSIKPSDTVKDLNLDLFIDQKDYFIKKMSSSFKTKPPSSIKKPATQVLGVSKVLGPPSILGLESSLYNLEPKESSITVVTLFDSFGKDQVIIKPAKSLSFEEFYKKAVETSELYLSIDETGELTKRGRDATRLSDIASIQQVINFATQEASANSKVLCAGKSDPCSGSTLSKNRNSDGTGWLKVDLQTSKEVSIPTLPLDPLNNSIYHYTYCSNGNDWEIDTVLESNQYKSKMENDGGDDPLKYESGSKLDLINKVAGCRF